jgi:hypothetical protein
MIIIFAILAYVVKTQDKFLRFVDENTLSDKGFYRCDGFICGTIGRERYGCCMGYECKLLTRDVPIGKCNKKKK